jgi:hypothetical protein
MKTTVDLPDKLLRQIKLAAVRNGRKMKDFMADLLRKGLAVSAPPDSVPRRPIVKADPQTGLPFVQCSSDAPARRMTVEDLIEFEERLLSHEALEHIGVSR